MVTAFAKASAGRARYSARLWRARTGRAVAEPPTERCKENAGRAEGRGPTFNSKTEIGSKKARVKRGRYNGKRGGWHLGSVLSDALALRVPVIQSM